MVQPQEALQVVRSVAALVAVALLVAMPHILRETGHGGLALVVGSVLAVGLLFLIIRDFQG